MAIGSEISSRFAYLKFRINRRGAPAPFGTAFDSALGIAVCSSDVAVSSTLVLRGGSGLMAQVDLVGRLVTAALILHHVFSSLFTAEQPKRTGGRIARGLGGFTVQSIEIRKHRPAPDVAVG